MSLWYDMLISRKDSFVSSLLLLSMYMQQILWNTSQAIFGSLCVPLLWLKSETLIVPGIVFIFCLSEFHYYLFTHTITLQKYLIAECI